MEAQVENNVKKKQRNKEQKRKKTHMYRIESLKTWGTGENIGKERT